MIGSARRRRCYGAAEAGQDHCADVSPVRGLLVGGLLIRGLLARSLLIGGLVVVGLAGCGKPETASRPAAARGVGAEAARPPTAAPTTTAPGTAEPPASAAVAPDDDADKAPPTAVAERDRTSDRPGETRAAAGTAGRPAATTAKEPGPVDRRALHDQLVELMELSHGVQIVTLGSRQQPQAIEVAVAVRGASSAVDSLIVTKDGRVLLSDAIDLDQEISRLADDRKFAGCLMDGGVRLFIDGRKRADRRQAAVVGRFSNGVVTNCAGAGKKACADAKVTKTPTWKIGNVTVVGARSRRWLEAATACK